ncbi:GTPase of the mitochondrial inner membrane that associates with the large ribosomal subunit [Coemansia spiralis]|uniref:GTPase of the mitochondrial inner membrane that associates with the large ribosomal subunit n=2 Tax=Coemansia TaxID=4863 RepID=A0A9W8G633_9FUNG|nr:GTPase of the mitochondrial inner membrane that associates with the large ribosomal subunit [Coemansia umbellata]KAJ2618711.1 GTPase of the mitochondrial inner membrane that associates with the large ribosomal subunit [Coemansia sp. RSA 1358]KAJ2674147.1 GTPase of the mitochondrial inner membrane that associates with the large ribosomal subunit [Coemansia spiralis]
MLSTLRHHTRAPGALLRLLTTQVDKYAPLRRNKRAGRNFIDHMRCTVVGGRGGSGCVSFFRDTRVADGPPDGGDGGRGGSVWFVADANETSLSCVRQLLRAQPGTNGRGKSMHGTGGADLVVRVPRGTVVREVREVPRPAEDAAPADGFLGGLARQLQGARSSELFVHYPRWEDRNNTADVRLPADYAAALAEPPAELCADLAEHGQRALVARGGLGGAGNPHFFSGALRRPHFALHGLPGTTRTLELELKTIAHAGLVGMPNAGKSTFLRAVSNAHPRVAPYAFTTLNPYIGTVTYADMWQLTIADIPGIVPGAHRNVGLGHAFLRHIERSRVLVFIVDVSRPQPWADLDALRDELERHQPGLSRRPSVVIANKADREEARANFERWQQMTDTVLVPVSAKLRKNILKATHTIRRLVESAAA